MSMKIVPIYIENSKLLGNCQINTRGITHIEKHKDLVFVPWFDPDGKLSSIRVHKGASTLLDSPCEVYLVAGTVNIEEVERE